MIKELKIYKKPDKKFILNTYKPVTSKHRRLFFEDSSGLEYDCLIWAEKDLNANRRENILAVEYVYEDGSVRVRLSDENSMKKLRPFDWGETFLLIASFKENKDGNTKINLS